MKKILVVFALFAALFLMISCGGGSKNIDTTDTGETVTDEDTADTGSTDTDEPAGDTGDGGDTSSDTGDSTDTTHDSGDSQPVSDSGDSADDEGADTTPDNDSDLDDSGDDADSTPDEDADTIPEPTEAEKCIAVGGIWNGSECLNPCDPNPCSQIANSTGVCTVMNATSHSCGCEQNYFWNGSKCINPCPTGYFWSGSECVNPCEDTPCSGVAHSTGTCSATAATVYTCSCEENYSWTGSACFHPCDNDPCHHILHSTGTCTIIDTTTYTCGCENNYFWTGSECVNPCDDNPCNTKAHAVNDSCSNPTDWNKYTCECGNSYSWNGSECLPECSASTTTFPCYDSTSHLTWSKRADTTYTWRGAGTYCDNLTEGGYSDWRLPNINELRTLIKNCAGSQTGGSCAVQDPSCLSSSCYSSNCYCSYMENNGGYYSKLGDDDTVYLWSSSTLSGNTDIAWYVNFSYGYVDFDYKTRSNSVRCVR